MRLNDGESADAVAADEVGGERGGSSVIRYLGTHHALQGDDEEERGTYDNGLRSSWCAVAADTSTGRPTPHADHA